MPRSQPPPSLRSGLFAAIVFFLVVGAVDTAKAQAIYNSIPSPLPGNVLSTGLEASASNELGDGLIFTTGSNRALTTVKVVFSSFACTNGNWYIPAGTTGYCYTTPGTTFSQAVTLNIYAVNGTSPGALLATTTQSFPIPYRPSSDAANCGPTGTLGGDGEEWYSAADNACYHGIATIGTFDLSSFHLVLPSQVIVGITYNTTHYGYHPVGEAAACFTSNSGCPYDSLNVSTDGSPFLGTNIDPDSIYAYYTNPAESCSLTTSGSFEIDTSCWTNEHPEIEVDSAAVVNAVSVSPNSGTGLTQTFTAVYTDVSGASDLQVVYIDFATSAGSAYSCFVAYVQASNSLYLLNDANSAILGPVTPGSATTVSNSQCTLSGSGGTVTSGGNTLTVPFAITFSSGYGGLKNVYGQAQSYSGVQSGWQLLGSWTPAPAAALGAVSVTPINGSGLGPFTFGALYTDPNGASDIQVVYLFFGSSTPTAPNSCFVAYVPSGNQLYLFNDANNGLVSGSPITAGSSSTLSNSQCTLSGSGGLATLTGNNLTAPFNITFTSGFGGSHNVSGLAQSYSGAQSSWQLLGTWNP